MALLPSHVVGIIPVGTACVPSGDMLFPLCTARGVLPAKLLDSPVMIDRRSREAHIKPLIGNFSLTDILCGILWMVQCSLTTTELAYYCVALMLVPDVCPSRPSFRSLWHRVYEALRYGATSPTGHFTRDRAPGYATHWGLRTWPYVPYTFPLGLWNQLHDLIYRFGLIRAGKLPSPLRRRSSPLGAQFYPADMVPYTMGLNALIPPPSPSR